MSQNPLSPFERWLKEKPLRQIPGEWEAQILGKAISQRDAAPSFVHPSPKSRTAWLKNLFLFNNEIFGAVGLTAAFFFTLHLATTTLPKVYKHSLMVSSQDSIPPGLLENRKEMKEIKALLNDEVPQTVAIQVNPSEHNPPSNDRTEILPNVKLT